MSLLQQIGDITGLRPVGHILLEAATAGLFALPAFSLVQLEHWFEKALYWGMMIVAIGAHIYTIRKVRNEMKKPPTP